MGGGVSGRAGGAGEAGRETGGEVVGTEVDQRFVEIEPDLGLLDEVFRVYRMQRASEGG